MKEIEEDRIRSNVANTHKLQNAPLVRYNKTM